MQTQVGHSVVRAGSLLAGLAAAAFLCGAAAPRAEAAATFTKITTGELVTTSALGYWGGVWGDYDDDGWLDVFVGASYGNTRNFLYHNNQDGTFSRVADEAMPKLPSNQHGSAWADYDNDGHLDLIVTSGNPEVLNNVIYRNNGDATFSWLTQNPIYSEPGHFHGPSWGDYDNDGLVDLFIGGHEERNRLFHNDGGGAFTRITDHPFVNDPANSEGRAFIDYDDDGDLDLFVSNMATYVNVLYRNDGGGTFTRVTDSGLSGSVEQTTASCFADYDNDGSPDLFLANYGQPNSLYHNNGNGTFTRITDSGILLSPPIGGSLNCGWADYDNDGLVDLYLGWGEPYSLFLSYSVLYHNDGNGKFSDATAGEMATGRGGFPAWGDYDRDGFVDLLLPSGAFDPTPRLVQLFHNDGNANAWLNVKLVGTTSNRSAIGAKVRVRATLQGASVWQLRDVSGGSGQENQQSLNAEFGLADATAIDTLRVEWPSGLVQEWHDVAPRQFLTVTEHCAAFGEPGADADLDRVPDSCDSCPTIANNDQSDADNDGVGGACDNCVNVANSRVAADYLTTNPWATLTGDQRDDDHDGYGNKCDADFTPTGAIVGTGDLTQFRASSSKNRGGDTCGTSGLRPCALFDLDEVSTLIGTGDLTQFRLLSGKAAGPKCPSCPLACTAGSAGSCD